LIFIKAGEKRMIKTATEDLEHHYGNSKFIKSEFHSRLRQVNDEVLWPGTHFFLTFEISDCSCSGEVVVTHESKTGRWQANICI
jgi:hypothetical protein